VRQRLRQLPRGRVKEVEGKLPSVHGREDRVSRQARELPHVEERGDVDVPLS